MKRLIKKLQNISNSESYNLNVYSSRLRKIVADAYDWVKERAEYIKDKNPDMDEGESYGIAWVQYKKEHPKWKSKKQKEKKAELFSACYDKIDNKSLGIYKNPTPQEIDNIKQQDEYGSIRGVILDDGTCYCWLGIILHKDINQTAEQQIPVNNVLRFAFDTNWVIDLHKVFTKDQGLELIRKNEFILSQIGNIQAGYFIYESSNGGGRMDFTYNDIYKIQ